MNLPSWILGPARWLGIAPERTLRKIDGADLERALESLRGLVEGEISRGFTSFDEVTAMAVECAADADGVDLPWEAAEGFVRLLLIERLERERAWTEPTDCDRLDAAFVELEAAGIIARQHLACCQSCGGAEIEAEMDAAAGKGRPYRGYAFYHAQDTDAAMDGDGVYLAYGAAGPGTAASEAIGREIVETLRRHGLVTTWNGSCAQRIHVPLDWKRRWREQPSGEEVTA